MLINAQLRSWLDHPAAPSRALQAMEDFKRDYAARPEVIALEAAAGPGASLTPLLVAARSFCARDDFFEDVAARLCDAARADPFFRPPFRTVASEVHDGLLLIDRPLLMIQLACMGSEKLAAKRAGRRGQASLAFTGQRSLFRFIDGGGATLSLWEAPKIEASFSAETSGRCRLVERRAIVDGETLELDGAYQTFVIDHAPRDLVYVHAATPLGAAPLLVEYDSRTLRFAGASSTDEASSRTQFMLALLRLLDRQDAVPVFAAMLDTPHFYARWQTMRELLALDAGAALPHLRRMAAADPHPEVRAAAQQTLALIVEEEVPQPCHA